MKLTILISTIIAFASFGWGMYEFLLREENRCEMTYMYEYPHYVKIPLNDSISSYYPHYGLYVYGEGSGAEQLRRKHFTGIPVLFIPGNAGSHRQVRSLASVALRKAQDSGWHFHFDFFAVDLHEELLALYGGALESQSNYVAECIRHIMSLYKDDKRPDSVILIAHSMGGIIAKHLFMLPTFDNSWVRLIITLATPHAAPVLGLDDFLLSFYHKTQLYWDTHDQKHVTLVSVGGGERDIQVRLTLAYDKHSDINVSGPKIPGLWSSVDHLCATWCKQLVIVIIRGLFDSIESLNRNKQLVQDKKRIEDTFKYHLIQRWGSKRVPPPLTSINMPGKGNWNVLQPKPTYLSWEKIQNPIYFLLPMEINRHVVVSLSGSDDNHWAFGCSPTNSGKNNFTCSEPTSISEMGRIYPRRKVLIVEGNDLINRGYSHLLIRLINSREPVRLHVGVCEETLHNKELLLNSWPLSLFSSPLTLSSNTSGLTVVNVTVKGMHKPWQSIKLTGEISCPVTSQVTIILNVPWEQGNLPIVLDNINNSRKIQITRPRPDNYRSDPYLLILVESNCKATLSISPSIPASLESLVRNHTPLLCSWLVAILCLAFARQVQTQIDKGYCPALPMAMMNIGTPFIVIIYRLAGLAVLAVPPWLLVPSDMATLQSRGEEGLFISLWLYLVAHTLLIIIWSATWAFVLLMGNVAHSAVLRLLMRGIRVSEKILDIIVKKLSRFPTALAIALVAICLGTCGTLGIIMALLLYFLKLFQQCEDLVEGLLGIPSIIRRVRTFIFGPPSSNVLNRCDCEDDQSPLEKLSLLHWHFTIMLMFLFCAILNAPPLLIWLVQVHNGSNLSPDPSFFIGVISCATLCVLWQEQVPRSRLVHSGYLSNLFTLLAVLVLLYGSVSIHRCSEIICVGLIFIALHQSLSPAKEEISANPEGTPTSEEESSNDHSTNSISNDCIKPT